MEYKLLGNSYACHSGGRIPLGENGARISVSSAPDGCAITVGGRRFPLCRGVAQIPPDAFCTGINRVTIELFGSSIPAESIIKTGGGLAPAGVSITDAILALDRRITSLTERLVALEGALDLALCEEGLFA